MFLIINISSCVAILLLYVMIILLYMRYINFNNRISSISDVSCLTSLITRSESLGLLDVMWPLKPASGSGLTMLSKQIDVS